MRDIKVTPLIIRFTTYLFECILLKRFQNKKRSSYINLSTLPSFYFMELIALAIERPESSSETVRTSENSCNAEVVEFAERN